jgi:hypothetical protein
MQGFRADGIEEAIVFPDYYVTTVGIFNGLARAKMSDVSVN